MNCNPIPRFTKVPAILTVAALGAISMAGCAVEAGELEVGDCLKSPHVTGPRVQVVDCNEPHGAQVVGLYRPVGGPYPGAEILAAESEDACETAFADFVGSDPLTSVLDLFPLLPTEAAWGRGETAVVCVAATYNEQMVRSSFEDAHR